jgi:hypothetical protein
MSFETRAAGSFAAALVRREAAGFVSPYRSRARTVAHLPLRWANYADRPSGASLWYPQGFAYDDAGWLLIHYAATGLSVAAIVVYDASYTYRGWFQVVGGGESIVASGSFAGEDLVLWKRNASAASLVEYAIGAMPANGTVLGTPTTRIASDVGTIFARQGGLWLIEQAGVDFAGVASRTRFKTYDAAFNQIGAISLPINVVGYMTSASPLYPYVPKMQGLAIDNGSVVIATGGSWRPAIDGAVAPLVADIGLARLGFDGSVRDYQVFDAEGVLAKWTAEGLEPVRTENEGLYVHPISGFIHTLNISRNSTDTVAGVVITEHNARDGNDWSDIPSLYTPIDLKRLTDGFLPRNAGGAAIHPLTGTAFTTMDQILDMAVLMQLPRVSWFSASTSVTLTTGIVAPASGNYTVEVVPVTTTSFQVTLRATSAYPYTQTEFIVFGTAPTAGTPGSWTARPRVFGRVPFEWVSDHEASTVTDTTSETVLKTYSIPGGVLGPNGRLDFDVTFSLTAGSTTPREFRVYINGTLIRRLTATAGLGSTVVQHTDKFRVCNRGSESAQVITPGETAAGAFGGTSAAIQTEAINTAATMTVTIAAIPSTTGDTFGVQTCSIVGTRVE